jgi:hypothetical protein
MFVEGSTNNEYTVLFDPATPVPRVDQVLVLVFQQAIPLNPATPFAVVKSPPT